MSYDAIGRRYARAIFDIGKEEGTLPTLTREFGEFAKLYADNDELRTVLGNPLVGEPVRESVLIEIGEKMGLSKTAIDTLRLLAQRRRLEATPNIARELERLADEDGRIVRAEVTSAAPLSPAYLDRLRAELERATGNKVVIIERHDPTLIAGVVTRIGDRMIDGSVRARLSSFRDSLMTN